MMIVISGQALEFSADTWISLIALVISIISFVLSLIALYQNRNLNTTNLQATYFEGIFRKYILEIIPNAVEKLHFENGRLSVTYKELNNVMMDMIKSARYYAYAKHDFYKGLKDRVQTLEDKLIVQAGLEIQDVYEQSRFIYGVHEDIMSIITYINKNYHKF